MKKILFRKLLFDCLKFFLITVFGISIIVWVFQAVNYLDIMVEDGRNYGVYFNYTFLSFPKIISKIIPFAIFFSFFSVLSKYELNNELVVYWIHGVNKSHVINFIFKISLIIMILQIFFLSLIVPKTQDLARSTIRDSNINFFDNFIKPKKFNDVIKGITIYSEKKNKDGELKNIYIKKSTSLKEFEVTYAKNGKIQTVNNTQVLVLFDGQNIKGKEDNFDSFSFSKSNFNLTNLESNTTTYKKIQENSSIDLMRCYDSLILKKFQQEFKVENCDEANASNVSRELYKRIIIPLYIPIFIQISMLLILISKENTNYLKLKLLIFILGLCVIIFSETTLRFIDSDTIKNIKIITVPFILSIIIYQIVSIKLKKNYKVI